MDARSEAILATVHPDLAAVMRAAAQTPQGFICDYGVRTEAEEAQAVATGHSETMHSRHLPDPNFGDVSMAVDVIATGDDPFAVGHEQAVFGQIAAQVMTAAVELCLNAQIKAVLNSTPGTAAVQWGGAPVGAWVDGQPSGFRDWGHFQLDPSAYP